MQVGAFAEKPNALAMEKRLKADGYPTYVVLDPELWKVQVGAYGDERNARAMEKRLKQDGYSTYLVFEED